MHFIFLIYSFIHSFIYLFILLAGAFIRGHDGRINGSQLRDSQREMMTDSRRSRRRRGRKWRRRSRKWGKKVKDEDEKTRHNWSHVTWSNSHFLSWLTECCMSSECFWLLIGRGCSSGGRRCSKHSWSVASNKKHQITEKPEKYQLAAAANRCANCPDCAVGAAVKLCRTSSHKTP